MRWLVVALALLLAPVAAQAQRTDSVTVALQDLGLWTQQVVAAQQPAIDAYQRCSPVMREVGALVQASDKVVEQRAKSMVSRMHACVSEMRTAGMASREALERIGPIPKMFEDATGIDSSAVLRQAIVSLDAMIASLHVAEEMLTALANGDYALALSKAEEGRELAGSAVDGQISLFQAMRASMPLETHKAMFDLRILMLQAMREVLVYDADADRGETSALLRTRGADLRSASARLRANWKRDSKDLRDLVAGLNDPSRTAVFGALDRAFETMASVGDEAGALLSQLPAGALGPSDAINILDRLAMFEVRILEAIRAAGAAASKVS